MTLVTPRVTDRAIVEVPSVKVTAPVPAGERELRLDLFRGIALWLIFIDHLPTNILTWFTIRNYGFSDATEIFIFIFRGERRRSSAAVRCLIAALWWRARQIFKRVWQIYVAHVFLFTIYLAEIYYIATRFENPLFARKKWAFSIFSSSRTS